MNNPFKPSRMAWLIFFILFAIFVDNVGKLSVNVPFSDDFHQQLLTAINLSHNNEVLPLLLRQHNEHRLFTTHIFTYLDLLIFDEINLDRQVWVSFILLLALALALASLSKAENRPTALVFIAVLIFSPSGDSTWVGGTIQYYTLLLFGLLSLKWLKNIDKPQYLIASIISMFLAIFSMIAGILVPIIGFIHLITSKKILRIHGIIWSLFGALLLFSYFNAFVPVSHHPPILAFLEDPEYTFDYTFRVLGAFFNPLSDLDILTDVITLTFIIFTVQIFRKVNFRNLVSSADFLVYMFVLLAIGSIVAGRVGVGDTNGAYADRYYIITKTLWVLGFILLLNNKVISNKISSFVLGILVALIFLQYKTEIVHLEAHQLNQSQAMVDYLVRDDYSKFHFSENNQPAGQLVSDAMALGIYSPGLRPTNIYPTNNFQASNYSNGLDVTVIHNKRISKYLYYAFVVDNSSTVHEVALVPPEHQSQSILLKPARLVNPDRLSDIDMLASNENKNIYEVIIDTSKLDHELTYDILVLSSGSVAKTGTI